MQKAGWRCSFKTLHELFSKAMKFDSLEEFLNFIKKIEESIK